MNEAAKFWFWIIIALIAGLIVGYILGYYVIEQPTAAVVGSKGLVGA